MKPPAALRRELCQTLLHVDLALVLGSGFPPFRGGLLAYADKLGIKTVYDKLKSLESVSSARFKPAHMIETMAANNQTFYKR